MSKYIVVYRQGEVIPPDPRVTEAIGLWAKTAEWPMWFAKNVVLWRKAHKLHWESCR